ncbi:hypothetical protein LTR85_011871 [Meristemomyces frigidus]|nr:hypothetical protein LTR85_011871 [Meristemomyces frigidus]
MTLAVVEFGLAAKWLATVCDNLGPQAFGKLQFRSGCFNFWKGIPSIIPILQLHSSGSIGLDLDLIQKRPFHSSTSCALLYDEQPKPDSFFLIDGYGSTRDTCLRRALENVANIGRGARLLDWSERRLREKFWRAHRSNILALTGCRKLRESRLAKAEAQRRLDLYQGRIAE